MAAHRPVEWVQAVVSRFDEQVTGPWRAGGGSGVGVGTGRVRGEGAAASPAAASGSGGQEGGISRGGLGGGAGKERDGR